MPLRPPAGFISANYDPLKNPDAPTGVSATGGDASASVSFTAPTNVGGSAITAYYAVSNPSQVTVSGTSSPINVTGLSNGTSYTFQVWALNSFGPGPFSAASGSVTPSTPRGLFAGGQNSSGSGTNVNTIQYITITTTGNSTYFGDLTTAGATTGLASSTRGVFGPIGAPFVAANTINYVTIASTGNASSFGQLSVARAPLATCSSSTRGLFAGGDDGSARSNVIDYITIASVGNATDFGDLTVARNSAAGCASPTRGVFAGGAATGGVIGNVIDYVTIATTGNATDFGDLSQSTQSAGGCSSSTRGLFAGGYGSSGSPVNVIEYVTIASVGNATDFGDLTQSVLDLAGCSSATRGVFGGGATINSFSATTNVIQYVTIASVGNATDFGDLSSGLWYLGACSNSHGGL